MTYTIRSNQQFNSKEIFFDDKPSEAIRTALKDLKFRWHSIKKCWYGYAEENEIVNIILENSTEEENNTVVSDGYLGGGAVYGSKSNLSLYGADLAKAIRQDIKAANIKGVTIASKNGNIQATVKIKETDVKTKQQFIEEYKIKPSYNWIYIQNEDGKTETINTDLYYSLDANRQENIRKQAAEYEYFKTYQQPQNLNHYHLENYIGFTTTGLAKIKKVYFIISSYRYDKSNSMVDYFDTNFYIDIYTKPMLKNRTEQQKI